ncbi:unnamed protein product [Brassica rapa]|uniref:Uncharacterized protein n=1 Tax=Brassica campestris TaxID=3711 RepID=A0A8D9CPV1_BRACM|nr:unnamed protein product [Brassica rapa]
MTALQRLGPRKLRNVLLISTEEVEASTNRSDTMADERKHEEPLPNLDPTVEVVERESLLDKISEKPSSPSSLNSKVYRLFGRERPVHKAIFGLCILSILGGCCSFLTLAYNNAYYDFKCLFVYYNNADECIWFLDCISALVLLFTVPLIYHKYEDKVDSYGEKAMAE